LRFSTSTLAAGTEIVPWLAAAGKLAYSKRCHHWFGDPLKHHPKVRLLFRFWNAALKVPTIRSSYQMEWQDLMRT